jgi:hypothetical protein
MSQPNNNGHEKKKLLVVGPMNLPKSSSLTWDYYKCNIDTDNLQTSGVLQVPVGTDIDRVRSSAMHSHAKVANDLQIEFDPFNATITIYKITLPLQE